MMAGERRNVHQPEARVNSQQAIATQEERIALVIREVENRESLLGKNQTILKQSFANSKKI